MNEFLDSKDGGTAILSHFYLLTGCANSVWFEGYVVPACLRQGLKFDGFAQIVMLRHGSPQSGLPPSFDGTERRTTARG